MIKECEEEAIAYFGAEKIGTKQLRTALSEEEVEIVLSFLIKRLYAKQKESPIIF